MQSMKKEKQTSQKRIFKAFPKYLLDAYSMACMVLVFVRDRQEVPYKPQLLHTKEASFTSNFS